MKFSREEKNVKGEVGREKQMKTACCDMQCIQL